MSSIKTGSRWITHTTMHSTCTIASTKVGSKRCLWSKRYPSQKSTWTGKVPISLSKNTSSCKTLKRYHKDIKGISPLDWFVAPLQENLKKHSKPNGPRFVVHRTIEQVREDSIKKQLLKEAVQSITAKHVAMRLLTGKQLKINLPSEVAARSIQQRTKGKNDLLLL